MKDIWPIEGPLHTDVSPSAIYRNGLIRNFLDSDRRTVLISAKGMGKTLLLRVKKHQLEMRNQGGLIIPRGAEFDMPMLDGILPDNVFSDAELWKVIWKASIIFSILSHQWTSLPGYHSVEPLWGYLENLSLDDRFQEQLRRDFIERNRNPPSFYVGEFLKRGLAVPRRFARSTAALGTMSSQYIHSECSVFIDGFDQVLVDLFPDDRESWRKAQIGLLKAINELNTHNAHIKVYASIRQEAFAAFNSPDKAIIRGKSTMLEYSRYELEEMFLLAVKRYSEAASIEEFLGVSSVPNKIYNFEEYPFHYIYRHSTGTPRSIMGFGGRLNDIEFSRLQPEERVVQIRNTVNQFATSHVYGEYLKSESMIFLSTLTTEQSLETIFKLIPTNILKGSDLQAISREFARRCGLDPGECRPFCDLYNIGLLGSPRNDAANFGLVQYFKKPYEFEWRGGEILQSEVTYFIHPSLHAAIQERNPKYALNRRRVVGDGYEWPSESPVFPKIFISHSSADKPFVEKVLPLLEEQMSLNCPCYYWYDSADIRAGDLIHEEVERGVRESDLVLVFVSEKSLKSKWVDKEWRTKHRQEIDSGEIQVVAVMIDGTSPESMPDFLREKKGPSLPAIGDSNLIMSVVRLAKDLAEHLLKTKFFR